MKRKKRQEFHNPKIEQFLFSLTTSNLRWDGAFRALLPIRERVGGSVVSRPATDRVAMLLRMPTDLDGLKEFSAAKILFGPAKAANAGGVAVSGLEQSQNALRLSWSRNEVDARLQGIMRDIHEKCVLHGQRSDNHIDYVTGANIAGFIRVADAMLAYGAI